MRGHNRNPPKHQSCAYISEAHKHDKNGWSAMLSPCLHVGLVHIRSAFSVLKASGSVTSGWRLRAVLCRLVVRVSPAGSLPGCLGQLENLEVLHLAGNALTGRCASAMPTLCLINSPSPQAMHSNEQCPHIPGRYASAMPTLCLINSPLHKPCTQMSNALTFLGGMPLPCPLFAS